MVHALWTHMVSVSYCLCLFVFKQHLKNIKTILNNMPVKNRPWATFGRRVVVYQPLIIDYADNSKYKPNEMDILRNRTLCQ